MCDVLARVAGDPALPESNRRAFLKALGATAAAGGLVAAGVGPARAEGPSPAGRGRGGRTRLVLLGTAGGPGFLTGERSGISTAVVYGDRVYVVDLGLGSLLRLRQSSLSGPVGIASALAKVRGVFFTHMHSDHLLDWPATYATGPINTSGRPRTDPPIRVFGPGNRGSLTRFAGQGAPPPVYSPDDPSTPEFEPTPGITEMTGHLTRGLGRGLQRPGPQHGLSPHRRASSTSRTSITAGSGRRSTRPACRLGRQRRSRCGPTGTCGSPPHSSTTGRPRRPMGSCVPNRKGAGCRYSFVTWCCANDGGRPSGTSLRGAVSNHPLLR